MGFFRKVVKVKVVKVKVVKCTHARWPGWLARPSENVMLVSTA